MDTWLSVLIIVAGVIVFLVMKKFSETPKAYWINFSIALLLLLLVFRTMVLDPLDWIGYTAMIICAIGFVFQLYLGFKAKKTSNSTT